mgnify:CR=1 FL=1
MPTNLVRQTWEKCNKLKSYNLGQNWRENSGFALTAITTMTNSLSFLCRNAPPNPPDQCCLTKQSLWNLAVSTLVVGGRGWLLECDIEGVVGKVTPAFKDSQPFLSKIVCLSFSSKTWNACMYEFCKYSKEKCISHRNVVMVFYSQLELINSNLDQILVPVVRNVTSSL